MTSESKISSVILSHLRTLTRQMRSALAPFQLYGLKIHPLLGFKKSLCSLFQLKAHADEALQILLSL